MTAVEWLVEQLQEHGYRGGFLPHLLFKQAKEMEKQQIIEAHGTKTKKSAGIANYLYTLSGEQYYNETYGSDDHIVDTKEMEKAATISKKEMVEISDEEIERWACAYVLTALKVFKQAKEMEKAATISKKEIVEISYEEIERWACAYVLTAFNDGLSQAFEQGAKWYREQLRQRK